MKLQQTDSSRDDEMMRLSSRISYGAIIKGDKEVEITRDMINEACEDMETLQSYPFCCEGEECLDIEEEA